MDRLFLDAPDGFEYRRDLITPDEESFLAREFDSLPFKQFEFHGYLGHRETVSYGWKYDFEKAEIKEASELPDFLHPIRAKAAEFAGHPPEKLEHVLVTKYRPGTVIGWHRDKAVFGDVVGISLLSECRFRFRRKVAGSKWERHSITLEPRSAYILRGAVRNVWEHSIPPVEALRYSITFRTIR